MVRPPSDNDLAYNAWLDRLLRSCKAQASSIQREITIRETMTKIGLYELGEKKWTGDQVQKDYIQSKAARKALEVQKSEEKDKAQTLVNAAINAASERYVLGQIDGFNKALEVLKTSERTLQSSLTLATRQLEELQQQNR